VISSELGLEVHPPQDFVGFSNHVAEDFVGGVCWVNYQGFDLGVTQDSVE
jgi:hypothetical protein